MNILILNGPNLNLLGERDPEIYGLTTLAEINAELQVLAPSMNAMIKCFQSNHEGSLIDHVHEERRWADGLIINPGALTHYSYALRDAIEVFGKQVIEVHLSDIMNREEFRRHSVLDGLANVRRIIGKGANGYYEALSILCGAVS
jgi:3-dehydroquinate dehydratase-2